MRTFKTGATRGSDGGKIDPEAALSPLVLEAYCSYMREHRLEGPRKPREDDDWQKGIPIASYMKSLLRHVLEAWRAYRQKEDMNDALFAVMFNTMGLLHENLKKEAYEKHDWYTEEDVSRYYYKGYANALRSKAIPTSPKTIEDLETLQDWQEFQRNMKASSLPNEDDYRDLVLQEQVDQADLLYDPKIS